MRGGEISARATKGQSRRVADVNLLHPDEAKSRGGGGGSTGRGRRVVGDGEQHRRTGDTGEAWQCVAYYTFLLFIILHKYRPHSGDAYPQNEGAGEEEGEGIEMICRSLELVSLTPEVFPPRASPDTRLVYQVSRKLCILPFVDESDNFAR